MGAADDDFDLIEPFESGDAFGHHSVRDIRRGLGQSAVKSAAYITGQSIHDERVGLTFGRPEKQGRVLAVGTVGPKGSSWTAGDLWGAAEAAETKSNARTGQTREVGLPSELDEAAHKRLLNGYTLWLRDTYGVAGTWALHAPSEHGDQRNIHGHINTTTRVVELDAEGRPKFGAKVRALSGDRKQVAAEFEKQRAEWARRVNAELEKAGSVRRLDHRSHARRAEAGDGPELEPSAHKGARQAAKERKDPKTRAKAQATEKGRKERNTAATAAWRAEKAERAREDRLHRNNQAQRAWRDVGGGYMTKAQRAKKKPWESDTVRLPWESKDDFTARKFHNDNEAYVKWAFEKNDAAVAKAVAQARAEAEASKRAAVRTAKNTAMGILAAADETTGGTGHIKNPISIPTLRIPKLSRGGDRTPEHKETDEYEAGKAARWEAAQAAGWQDWREQQEQGDDEDDRDDQSR